MGGNDPSSLVESGVVSILEHRGGLTVHVDRAPMVGHDLALSGVGIGDKVGQFVDGHIDLGHGGLVVDAPDGGQEVVRQFATVNHVQEGSVGSRVGHDRGCLDNLSVGASTTFCTCQSPQFEGSPRPALRCDA